MYELLEAYLVYQGFSKPKVRTVVEGSNYIKFTYTHEYSERDIELYKALSDEKKSKVKFLYINGVKTF